MMDMEKSQIIRILIYNAIFAGAGSFFISNYFHTQYNSVALLIILSALVVVDSFIDRKKLSAYGFKRPKLSDFKFAVFIFAIFFPIAIATRILFPSFDFIYNNALGLSYANIVRFLFYLLPVSILIEEIGTRALFQSKVTSIFGSKFAIYATLLNFTLLHFTWMFSADLANFAIIIVTVFIYAAFLVLLFDFTKNIFSTIAVHLMIDIVSAVQILFHIYSQFNYEMILWVAWGILFIVFFPSAVALFKKSVASMKGKLKDVYIKILLIIFSLFSLATVMFTRGL